MDSSERKINSTQLEELAKKYDIPEKDMEKLLTKYGSINEIYEAYTKRGILTEENDNTMGKIVSWCVDVDENPNKNYDILMREIISREGGPKNRELVLYSSDKFKEIFMEKAIRNQRLMYILDRRFGLGFAADEPATIDTLAKEFNVTRDRIIHLEQGAMKKLGYSLRRPEDTYIVDSSFDYENMTDEEVEQVKMIKRDIQLRNGDFSKNYNKLKTLQEKIKIRSKREMLKLENLGLSKRLYRILEDAGIDSLVDLSNIPEEQLRANAYIDTEEFERITAEMQKNEILFKEEQPEQKEKRERLKLENLDLSVRPHNILKRTGITSLVDLLYITEEQFRARPFVKRNLGPTSFEEVTAKMQQYGISFKPEEQLEQEETKKDELVKAILQQQKTIEEQKTEIAKLSSLDKSYEQE